ncbi:hypothetical protein L484_022414 [Morus notabilis]|uniref:Uncharacterized protein n=1 Tax=Morus notabilis TaxID=981085 RepID=W9R0Y8_9ROSA|nr:hypothetical protein L484_022414 [Morus notabilis]
MLRLFASVSKSLAGVLRGQVEEPAPAVTAVVEPSREEPEHAAVPENSVIGTYESGVQMLMIVLPFDPLNALFVRRYWH